MNLRFVQGRAWLYKEIPIAFRLGNVMVQAYYSGVFIAIRVVISLREK